MAHLRITTKFRLFNKVQGFSVHRCRPIITAPYEVVQKTIDDISNQLRLHVGTHKFYQPNVTDKMHRARPLPEQSELEPRSMKDSYDECIVPVASDEAFAQAYVSAPGDIRIGKLLENVDYFSVWLCYRHIQYPKVTFGEPSRVVVVTGMVDSIETGGPIVLQMQDVKLRGHVTHAGKTSLEVQMEVLQKSGNSWEKRFRARFVMVARDASSGGPAPVNPLKPDGPEEEAIFAEGVVNKQQRKEFEDRSVMKAPPTERERQMLHSIFTDIVKPSSYLLTSQDCPKGSVWMKDAVLSTTTICHPRSRNVYNNIFGGFIMKLAYELSWATVQTFCRARPSLLRTDYIAFRKPVHIGSILHFQAQVEHTKDTLVHIACVATVMDPDVGTKDVTNVFHFTFILPKPAAKVIPLTYPESLSFIEGLRYLEKSTDNNFLPAPSFQTE